MVLLLCAAVVGCGSGVKVPVSDTALKIVSTPAPGVDGLAYSSSLQASGGGTTSYTWSVQSGSLPQGLQLQTGTGMISGVPAQAGTSNLVVGVTDGQTSSTAAVALTVLPRLAVSTTSLPGGRVGVAYSTPLNATGGQAPYTWQLANGELPSGVQLSNGVLAGTPQQAGSFNFSISVSDSGLAKQTVSAQWTLSVDGPLSIVSGALPTATAQNSYSFQFSAGGGKPAYHWSVASGTLPGGMSLDAASGLLSGTPAAAGSFSFVVGVSDNSSPAQSATANVTLVVAAANSGSTWYVRPDGGTRYSAQMTTGQCDGLADAAYPGQGTNQHCAFKDVRNLWTDGTYCGDNSSTSTCWTWVGKGGDTYIIRGSIADGVTYRIGQNGPNSNDYYGLAGDPYGAGAPPPPSGTATAHTRILGGNFGSCTVPSARTQLHGGYGVGSVMDMSGASYVDVACLDITDFSSCGRMGQSNQCNTSFPLSDYATSGVVFRNTSTNDTLTDVRIHGLAAIGIYGPTGDGVVMTDVAVIGNAGAGWNADLGDGTTGKGSLLMQNYEISWNGCSEEYPITDKLPYQDCADDNSGGYGDGFGTATVLSPGWQVHFDQGVVAYNTQDGLDALHLIGPGASMTVTRTLAYGNMGNQIKVGGAAGSVINNVVMTNCNAMRQAIPGTPAGYNTKLSDFCRAGDGGIVLTGGAKSTVRFDYNTVYSASSVGIEIECDQTNGPCDKTSLIDFRNNVMVGFLNNKADGYPAGGTNDYSTPIYVGANVNLFTNPGSLYSNNLTYHPRSDWKCPAAGEQQALCMDPHLTDEAWHVYGYADVTPTSGIRVVQGAGTPISDVAIDFTGQPRTSPPNIGAYQ